MSYREILHSHMSSIIGKSNGTIELWEVVEARKPLVITAILVVGLVLYGLSDTAFSTADTSVPNNEVTSNISKADNSSASAAITITMYAVAGE